MLHLLKLLTLKSEENWAGTIYHPFDNIAADNLRIDDVVSVFMCNF